VHFYNGISAAKRIGISYKTLLRYIERGLIIPEEGKTPSGQLVISEEQVERLRRQVETERAQFGRSQTSIDSPSDNDIDSLWTAIHVLERRVSDLERQIEHGTPSPTVSLSEPQKQPFISPTPYDTDQAIQGPKNRIVTPKRGIPGVPDDLPVGAIRLIDFGKLHGIPESSIRRWAASGLIETTTGTQPDGKTGHWLTPEEQTQALETLRKHGKIK
jgi:DNA-binding transcriptional MerR regulator